MKDCSIQLTHHPGDFARVAQALARRGVNIKALAALSIDGQAVARILPDDIASARGALESANIRFEEGEVQVVLREERAREKLTGTGRDRAVQRDPEASTLPRKASAICQSWAS